MEVAELVYLSQFGHGLGAIIGNLVQDLKALLDICPILPLAGELAIDETERVAVAGIGLLSGDALLVVRHGLLQVHGDQGPFLINLAQEGAGLGVSPVGLLVVDVEPLDDIFLAVDAEEELVGIVQTVGLGACISDHFLDDLDLLDDWFFHLDHLALGPLLLQQVGDELVVSLGEFGTDEGLDAVLGLEEGQHLPLPRNDLEIVHRGFEPLGPVSPAAQKLCLLHTHQILPHGLQGGLGVIDQLPHLGVDLEIQGFFLEDGPDILEAVVDGIHVLAVLPGGPLLVLLHLGQQGTDILVQLPQPPQEVLLGLVDLGAGFGPLVLGELVGPLLLDFVDAPHAGDYLVVDGLGTHWNFR